ncbi:chaperone modulator CbpM [Actinopolymorpha pittospori]|uniref:DNA-binding transcriptional MerR regulator n=1 Tax=Actinopolymorpha pittospori TaxID=648752 RepID=A0A927RCT9_9ACTN|nr:chaperone modulator CbpM [Actinopolymorpha pittospori]MBE1611627.1 DNA-binding transcriptional MerR regulator [Actinopolymorpha pittospori]
MGFALVQVRVRRADDRLDLDAFARQAGLHPDLVRRLVALGLLDADADPSGALHFGPGELTRVARIERLRAGFGLNYAGIGVVIDLLDRIAELEAADQHAGLRPPPRQTSAPRAYTVRRIGGRSWT